MGGDLGDFESSTRPPSGAARALGILAHELSSEIARANSSAEQAITVARRAVRDALGPGPEFDSVDSVIREHLSRMSERQRAIAAVLRLGPLLAGRSAGSINLVLAPFPLELAVADAIAYCREDLALRDTSSCFERGSGSGFCDGVVVGDRELLTQAFKNVILSSAQLPIASHRDRPEPVRVTCEARRNSLLVIVSRYGSTIPDSDELSSGSRVREMPGGLPTTRLALSIFVASRIAEAHSGTVSVAQRSALGDGRVRENVFEVSLPTDLRPGARRHDFGPSR